MVPWEQELEDLLKLEEGLSDWEVSFVDDMSLRNTHLVTDKQIFKVHELWDKHCG